MPGNNCSASAFLTGRGCGISSTPAGESKKYFLNVVFMQFTLPNQLGLSRIIFWLLCHKKTIYAWRLTKNSSSPQTRMNTHSSGGCRTRSRTLNFRLWAWRDAFSPSCGKLFFASSSSFFRSRLALYCVGNRHRLFNRFSRFYLRGNIAIKAILGSAFS